MGPTRVSAPKETLPARMASLIAIPRSHTLSVIEEPLLIDAILLHLGIWDPRPPSQATPKEGDRPVNGRIPLTDEPPAPIARSLLSLDAGRCGANIGERQGNRAHSRRLGPRPVRNGLTRGDWGWFRAAWMAESRWSAPILDRWLAFCLRRL